MRASRSPRLLQYGFNNVQNLPPPHYKSFDTGSTVQFRWQWLNASGVPANTAGQAIVKVYACSCGGALAPGALLGQFTPASPGSGNSFQYYPSINKWEFNWKLTYKVGGITKKLPVGTYVVQAINSVTSQVDPGITNNCGGTSIKGALIKVVKQ